MSRSLQNAKETKEDEFYTQLSDIEKELKHYKEYFKDKVVYCNCDDPRVSNFFLYFSYNFEKLGLKKLITTCYKNQEIDLFSLNNSEQAIYLEYEGSKSGGSVPKIEDIGIKYLKGDGDFRSPESIELLKQADIVVTNPPFSLFREYVAQLLEYDKKFIVIGNKNSVTYRDVFSYLQSGRLWIGYRNMNSDMWFVVPGEQKCEKIIDGLRLKHIMACWYTNLDTSKRHEDLILYKTYKGHEDEYPKYENFDAINIKYAVDIPCDYAGYMGVPITFLDKYNPEQFEIVGLGISNSGLEFGVQPYKEEHKRYRKEVQKRGAVDGDLYMMVNGIVDVPYARIIIRNKRLGK